jgi:hypothetical protein
VRRRRRGFGNSGSIRAHRASSNIGWAMPDRTKFTRPVQEGRQGF